MTEAEESLFIEYCDSHAGLTSTIAQEFLILYYVNHARYMEAIRLHQKLLSIELEKDDAEKFHREALERRNSRQFGGDNNMGGKPAMSKSQKRQVLMNRLIAILPAAQKMVLKIEEERKKATGGARKASFAIGEEKTLDPTRSVVQSLMDQVDAPLASVKALDLDWITKSLAQNLGDDDGEIIVEEPEDEESTKGTVSDDQALDEQLEQALAAAKKPVSEVEVMELDDSDEDL